MRPVICMITDGRLRTRRTVADLVAGVRAAAEAGVHLIQIREHGLDDRDLLAVTRLCIEAARGTRARILVNDRLDVALAAGAHGVHLRSDSFSATRTRLAVAPGFLIGRSVQSVEDAKRAAAGGAVDYLVFGTVFATTSKPGRQPAGVTSLADVVRATTVPVLAVGGVTAENASRVAQTGAAGISAIGLFAENAPNTIATNVAHVTRAFDTPDTGS